MGLLLSILGQLPASNSAKGKIGEIDYLKIARMALIMTVSYVAIAVVETLIGDLSNGSLGIPGELSTPLTGVLALVLEWLRRKKVSPSL